MPNVTRRSRPKLGYIYCPLCIGKVPADETPASYGRLSVGISKRGVETWCDRHNVCIYIVTDKVPPLKLFCYGLGHAERDKLGFTGSSGWTQVG